MPISMPASPGFTRSRFGLETNTQTFESPLTKNVQRVMLGGARWTLSVTLPRMNRIQAAAWQAFLLQLEGRANTFYGFDPDAKQPRGAATGTPLVNGAGQTGSTLNIDGCTPNVIGWLRAGDYFETGGELKMLTHDANTNGSGQTTLYFKSPLRDSPADNATVTVQNPACEMILSDDMQAMWEANQNGIYEPITFTAVEVF
jgi:hypothetical protein